MVWESLSGWWLSHPSEKSEFVSWDDDIPNTWKIIQMFQTTNQLFTATWVALLICGVIIHCNLGGASKMDLDGNWDRVYDAKCWWKICVPSGNLT